MQDIRPLPELAAWRNSQSPRLSQKAAALKLGTTKPTISRWEAGKRRIDRDRLVFVSSETGISPRVLRPDLADFAEQIGEAAE
jgi:transcriptional regulator with XRE-family HTH domain